MRRSRALAIGLVAFGVGAAGGWLGLTSSLRPLLPIDLPAASRGVEATTAEDLMMDLQIAPLQPQAPPPLAVATLEGGRVTLADVRGHVVLVYFWATW